MLIIFSRSEEQLFFFLMIGNGGKEKRFALKSNPVSVSMRIIKEWHGSKVREGFSPKHAQGGTDFSIACQLMDSTSTLTVLLALVRCIFPLDFHLINYFDLVAHLKECFFLKIPAAKLSRSHMFTFFLVNSVSIAYLEIAGENYYKI